MENTFDLTLGRARAWMPHNEISSWHNSHHKSYMPRRIASWSGQGLEGSHLETLRIAEPQQVAYKVSVLTSNTLPSFLITTPVNSMQNPLRAGGRGRGGKTQCSHKGGNANMLATSRCVLLQKFDPTQWWPQRTVGTGTPFHCQIWAKIPLSSLLIWMDDQRDRTMLING